MSPLQRASVVGAALWLLSHGVLVAGLGLSSSSRPGYSVAACLLVLLVTTWLLLPLRGGDPHLGVGAAWAAAAVLPLSGLAVMPFLPTDLWRAYPNWWPGAGQVIVTALVIRRRPGAAVAGVLASAVVILGCVLSADDLPDSVAGTVAALNQPALLWLPAALAARHLLDSTARTVARYSFETEQASAVAAATAARTGSARARRGDLELTVVPLLTTLGGARPDDDATWAAASRSARVLEGRLRDDLRARALLDPVVRVALRDARARGNQVDVVDDRRRGSGTTGGRPGEEALFGAGRTVLTTVLARVVDCRVTARLPPGGDHLTFAVEGAPAQVAPVAAALERLADRMADPGWGGLSPGRGTRLVVDHHPGSLWAELAPD